MKEKPQKAPMKKLRGGMSSDRQGELQEHCFHPRKEEGGREDGTETKKVPPSQ